MSSINSFISFYDVVIYVGAPLLVSLATWSLKGILERIRNLEFEMQRKTSETQVRQLVSDKYDPLASDIREIKETQAKMLDLYLEFAKTNHASSSKE